MTLKASRVSVGDEIILPPVVKVHFGAGLVPGANA